ncbi:MAG: DUF4276 family protein [Isosphaeraceae bacterium]|jgi:hypothetical protein
MRRIIFLLEEYSMKVLLDGLLPRLVPGLQFLCVPHEGKQDLDKSVPRKLRAWREPGVRFVVLRDKDGADCHEVKHKLVSLCEAGGHPNALVRIACQELEAWYLGQPAAMANAFENKKLRKIGAEARYRDPDAVDRPSAVIVELVPEFQKVSGARRMARALSRKGNKSRSFQAFLTGIDREAAVLGETPSTGGEA